MNYPHQEIEAKAFLDANAVQVGSVLSDLKVLSQAYLVKFGTLVFEQEHLNELEQALDRDVIQFGIELRRLAAIRKGGFGAEGVYWDIVDGIYSMLDALGAQWRYMTLAGRENRVKHAIEHARQVRLAI